MTLFKSVRKLPQSAIVAGFVSREAEDVVARQLLRPLFPTDGEAMLLAGFDAYSRLIGFECAPGDRAGRCVIAPGCWNRLLGIGVSTIVMAHNHPSGIARPSDADLACTQEAAHFLRLVGIDLVDHLIFVESGHFSFRNAQLI
ncbi:MAG: DNA repair protein RadC [Sphingomonadales bacterium]|nr:DNA repair protein RadC [Sphingomonadales bacterium]